MTRLIDIDGLLERAGLERSCTIGVGVSGGRDSVALLDMLADSVRVVAINVEHGIRGENSVRDSEFVRKLCERRGIPLYSFSVDSISYAKQKGYTLEQAARELRYNCFEECLDSGKCDVVALAHHMDDQAETVLMRIFRGTGVRGLAGMREVGARYIRPLIHLTREDIDAYIEERDLEYVEDETNGDPAYMRNFLRQELNRLKERYPSIVRSISRLSDNAAEVEEYLTYKTPKPIVKDGEVYIKTSYCADKLIFKRMIVEGAKALNVRQDIEQKHFELLQSLASLPSSRAMDLTHGLRAHREGEYIVLSKRDVEDIPPTPFTLEALSAYGYAGEIVGKEEFDKDKYDTFDEDSPIGRALYFDMDKLPSDAILRGRQDGDRICKFGGGSKSLGDFLTDKKVPLRMRASLPLIAVGSDVYVAIGVEISSHIKVDESTRRICVIYRNRIDAES